MDQPYLEKRQWVESYAGRILAAFTRWQSPLGVDEEYAEFVQDELSEYYDNPLKRALIESSYPPEYAVL